MEMNEPLSYEEECERDAGQTYYFNVNGVPVKEVYTEDGRGSTRYGLKDNGEWEVGYPSDELFMSEGQKIEKDEFERMVNAMNEQ